jgi:signal transduction histidine kinase
MTCGEFMADDLTTAGVSEPGNNGSRRLAPLPIVSDQLAQVADTLAALANSLHGVAASLKVSPPAGPQATCRAEFQANDLLSIVSHDLLAPLTAMSGSAVLIRQHAPSTGDGDVHGWANDILQSAAVMERLIRDLEGAKFDAPRAIADPHDVATLIDHAVEIFRPIAAAASLALTTDVAAPLLATFDSPKTFEVIAHLIENAIKFTPVGGSIRIAAARHDAECVVSVADTGIGIPEARLATLFEPFQDSSGDRRASGVGLYIARWIVEAHGGRMWATSKVGLGSAFYFTLPLAN